MTTTRLCMTDSKFNLDKLAGHIHWCRTWSVWHVWHVCTESTRIHESRDTVDCPRDSSSDRQTRLMASLLKATLTLMTPALSLYGAESVLLRFLLNCSLTLLSSITLPVFRFMTSRNQLQKLEEGGMRPCVCPWHQPTTQVMGTCGRLYHKVQESQLESCKSKWLWQGNTRQCSETCFSTRTTRSFVKHVSYKLDFV